MEHASYFDLKNGVFTNFQPIHEFYVKDENLEYFKSLLYEYQSAQTMIPALKRSVLLDIMLDYFMLHMDGFTEIKSVQVLKDVFH